MPNIPLPMRAPKGRYGSVTMQPALSLFNHSFITDKRTATSTYTKTFAEIGMQYGYLMYETTMPSTVTTNSTLLVWDMKDRMNVYLDQVNAGLLTELGFGSLRTSDIGRYQMLEKAQIRALIFVVYLSISITHNRHFVSRCLSAFLVALVFNST